MSRALRTLFLTFASGALSGLIFGLGSILLGVEPAVAVVDIGDDGIGVRDLVVLCWLFGNAAVVTHHIVPGLLRA